MKKRMLLMSVLICLGTAVGLAWVENVKVIHPERNGLQVGGSMIIRGKAELSAGQYIWVMVRREDFVGVWWPQGSAKIDPVSGAWKVRAVFGGRQDVGWDFDIAVVVVNDKEHVELMNYWIEAMKSGDFRPIELPALVGSPIQFKVKKVRH